MVGTVLLCILAIIVLIGVAAYVSWPLILAGVAAVFAFKLVHRLILKFKG